jgi:hypothetical protein
MDINYSNGKLTVNFTADEQAVIDWVVKTQTTYVFNQMFQQWLVSRKAQREDSVKEEYWRQAKANPATLLDIQAKTGEKL